MRIPFIAAIIALCLLSATSCGSGGKSTEPPGVAVTYQSTLVNGTPSWQASQTDLKPGTTVNATLVNSLSDTHLFQVAGLTEPVSVPAGGTVQTSFTLPIAAGNFPYYCPRHDPTGSQAGNILLKNILPNPGSGQ